MELLKSDFYTVVDLFHKAKHEIIISMPNLSDELAQGLIQQKRKRIDLNIFIEFDENIYRSGFGDITAIKKLRENQLEVKNKTNFNIYFIIVDDFGYFYFPKSQFLEKEGTSFDLFPMVSSQVKKLKLMFQVLDKEDNDYERLVEEVGIEKLEVIAQNIKKIVPEQSIVLETKLAKDPPLKPNLGRTLEVYKAKFQIAELKFKGANLHIKKVKLPRNALPFRDDLLKRTIEASLRLFTDIPEKDFFEPFFNLKMDLEIVRGRLMFYLKSREKNIIKREQKDLLEAELDKFRDKIGEIKKDLLNKLQQEINSSKKRVKDNLIAFLKDNVPDELKGLTGVVLEDEIENMANGIISRIRFPRSSTLLNELKLEIHYYDITWEDLNSVEVREELVKHKLITQYEKSYIDELAISAKKER